MWLPNTRSGNFDLVVQQACGHRITNTMYKTFFDGSSLFIKIVMMMTTDDLPLQLFGAHHLSQNVPTSEVDNSFYPNKNQVYMKFLDILI